MKAKLYIVILAAAAVAGSCSTSGRILQSEYDDLYYLPSDRPVATERFASREMPGNNQQEQYFDNIYSGDTLFAEQYNENVDFDNSSFYNKDNSPFEYADDWSYSNRLRRFYGGSIYPYWRDPFYYSWSMFPWNYYDNFYYPYWSSLYDPFYYYGGYYGGYYGYYGGLYNSFYSPFSFGYYSGYYWPTYNFYYRDNGSESVLTGRRERYSTTSRSYSTLPAEARGRTTTVTATDGSRRSVSTASTDVVTNTRRTESAVSSVRQSGTTTVQDRRDASTSVRSTATTRPEYNQVSRSYTPTYNNPRLSERPSYNNSRISGDTYQRGIPAESRSNTITNMRSAQPGINATERRSSSYSTGQMRSYTPSTSGNYSAPVNSSRGSSSSGFNSVSSGRRESSDFSSSRVSGGSFGGSSGSGSISVGSSGGSSSGSSGGVTSGTRR